MRVLVALGGNALLRRGESPDAGIQLHHVQQAARALAPLTQDHQLVISFGNGPQIGLLSLESENDPALSRPYPLDALGAQTQGMIGYWLAQSLRNAGARRPILGIVTQTLVDAADPALRHPTKFVGPGYSPDDADRLARDHHWTVALDGRRWRRVVPSPEPLQIVELDSITALIRTGAIVICGGGGAPVIDAGAGQLSGVEAVVDKDLAAALLAIAVDADRLLILTDVPGVMDHFDTPEASIRAHLDLEDLAEMSFPPGSMAPKIEACRRFVATTHHAAAIGALTDAAALLTGSAGTTISEATAATLPREDRPGKPPALPEGALDHRQMAPASTGSATPVT